jgi:hypothetical protein
VPNWVYNTVVINGDLLRVSEFMRQAEVEANDEGQEASDLSFENFIKPEASAYEHGGWYQWNLVHWGTKWDACEPVMDFLHSSGRGCATYDFNTAWSPPEPVFREMARQYPDLRFDITCVEEQGWGVVYEAEGGELSIASQWDIPASHEDWENMGREEQCPCYWGGGEYNYADCPKEEETA